MAFSNFRPNVVVVTYSFNFSMVLYDGTSISHHVFISRRGEKSSQRIITLNSYFAFISRSPSDVSFSFLNYYCIRCCLEI